jgi:hypothetical protein
MSKKLTEISSDLTISGFDVKGKNKHSCQADKHVQEFTQETGYIRPTTIVPELDI